LPSEQAPGGQPVSIVELSDTLAGAMRNIAAPGPGICPICRTFHDPAFAQCVSCIGTTELDVVVPISYAPRGDQLAHALRGYKDERFYATRYHHGIRLAAILWRFLRDHEVHVAQAAGVESFDVVAVVPSKTTAADEARPGLRTIVGTVVEHTAPRFERLLRPTDAEIVGRYFDPDRYATARPLDGESILLIDDTWVSGSSVQSAAAALRQAGAGPVAGVVIGRWLTPSFGGEWGTVGEHYARLPKQFDWSHCAAESQL
jgi:predicted amidophosphoribosyltransferase